MPVCVCKIDNDSIERGRTQTHAEWTLPSKSRSYLYLDMLGKGNRVGDKESRSPRQAQKKEGGVA